MPSRAVGDLNKDALSARFCYWQSESDERYLFSQIKMDELASFTDCVVLLALGGGDKPDVIWVGESSNLSPRLFLTLEVGDLLRLKIYVHLLAGNASERTRISQRLQDHADKRPCALTA